MLKQGYTFDGQILINYCASEQGSRSLIKSNQIARILNNIVISASIHPLQLNQMRAVKLQELDFDFAFNWNESNLQSNTIYYLIWRYLYEGGFADLIKRTEDLAYSNFHVYNDGASLEHVTPAVYSKDPVSPDSGLSAQYQLYLRFPRPWQASRVSWIWLLGPSLTCL